MIYFGIDISKYKHDCCVLSDLGEVLNEGFTFSNNAEGFGRLQKELEQCGKGNARIGFEATGNYGINLKLFLERIGFDYMEINPLLVKEYIRSNTLRRTTTDKLSAKAIGGVHKRKGLSVSPSLFLPQVCFKTTHTIERQLGFREKPLSNSTDECP